jgi:hypothetical protein
MQSATSPAIARRSSRVQTAVPILVTSLDGTHFSEVCETLVVNAHGCAMLSRMKFDAGAPLHFHSKDGRQTTAHVVSCQAVGQDKQSWMLGAKLDHPENFWGLSNCPKDWALPAVPVVASLPPMATRKAAGEQVTQTSASPLDRLAKQLEARVHRAIAESVRPLQAEILALKQQLAQKETNRSRFEVSLSSIPPELEQQLELRLQKYLGPKLLDETRQQSAHLLDAAKAAIEQKTIQGYEQFLHRAEGELKVIETRAEEISSHISANAREHLSRGLDAFQQKLLEGGNSLKRLTDQLVEYLQKSVNEEQDARREDLERLRASVASESTRLREDIEYLDGRIAKLNDSAQRLEAGLDQRLSQMASRTLSDTRGQLEALANEMLEQLTKRSRTEIGEQMDAARENLKMVQTGISTYVSESLKSQSAESLQAFEGAMQELATHCADRWRMKLAAGLNSLAKNIGDEFRLEG